MDENGAESQLIDYLKYTLIGVLTLLLLIGIYGIFYIVNDIVT